ncbi:MAG: haloacid dehalogenase-like hydrolase [Myxococcales bacterium]|nr:haloacid dehalogenase-like hydrolase [Myxococcales bacterium]
MTRTILYSFFTALLIYACAGGRNAVRPFTIEGFDDAANRTLADFFARTAQHPGRKIAVFDGDGTTLGQVPHYLADECLYLHAQTHPERKPEVIARMTPLSNVSLPYVQDRVHYFSGMTLQELRDLGDECFRKYYATKIYPPMRELIRRLHDHGFEVWIVTASPEALYQKFLSRELSVPITRVLGVKSVIQGGVITDRIVEPVPQDEGKLQAIETFVQDRPLLVGGNSRGDKEMIEYSADLRLIVNPDEFVAPGQEMSMADYAKRHGFLIVRIRDVAEPGFPAVSSTVYHVRTNAPHEP